MQFIDRLREAEARFNELTAKMTDPVVLSDQDEYRKVSKAQSELEELVSQISRVEAGGTGAARCPRDAQ